MTPDASYQCVTHRLVTRTTLVLTWLLRPCTLLSSTSKCSYPHVIASAVSQPCRTIVKCKLPKDHSFSKQCNQHQTKSNSWLIRANSSMANILEFLPSLCLVNYHLFRRDRLLIDWVLLLMCQTKGAGPPYSSLSCFQSHESIHQHHHQWHLNCRSKMLGKASMLHHRAAIWLHWMLITYSMQTITSTLPLIQT